MVRVRNADPSPTGNSLPVEGFRDARAGREELPFCFTAGEETGVLCSEEGKVSKILANSCLAADSSP